VLLAADGPEDYERLVPEFEVGHREAMEQFPRYLAGKLGEVRLVELGCPVLPRTRSSRWARCAGDASPWSTAPPGVGHAFGCPALYEVA
jgi:hypothetical protein